MLRSSTGLKSIKQLILAIYNISVLGKFYSNLFCPHNILLQINENLKFPQ